MKHRSKRDPATLANVRVCSRAKGYGKPKPVRTVTLAVNARQDLTVVGFRHGRKDMEPEMPENESYMYGFVLGRANKRG